MKYAHKDQMLIKAFEVAMILQRNGVLEQEILAAGILHDTLEDGDLNSTYLEKTFSARVKQLVLDASEELPGRKKRPWKIRKAHTLQKIQTLNTDAKLIICADKLSNARSMIRAYEQVGDKLWERFNAGFKEQRWYYDGLVEALKDLSGYPMYQELQAVVESIFHRKEA